MNTLKTCIALSGAKALAVLAGLGKLGLLCAALPAVIEQYAVDEARRRHQGKVQNELLAREKQFPWNYPPRGKS